MKAINFTKYGSTDFINIINIEKPQPKNNEVLIKSHASSINSYDHRILLGKPFPVRFREGLLKPHKNKILGADIAGTVEAVGENVTNFKIGDRIYGCLADNLGDSAYAEYVCAKENIFAPIPNDITFEQAASIPMAAMTALQGLRLGKIKSGQKVLINGASGGVGTFAVQIAKSFGAEVTGVCSNRNLEMISHIGADYVIDYAKEDYIKGTKQYDLILDIVANHSPSENRNVLKPNGICATVGFSNFSHLIKVMLSGKGNTKNQNKKIAMVMANNTIKEDLIFINKLLENKNVIPVIDGCYPLDKTKNAFQYFEKEHAKGKVIITVP